MELIKIVLDDGKEFVFRRDSLRNAFFDELTGGGEIPIADYLNKNRFISWGDEKDFYINTSKIRYVEIYEKKSKKKKKKI